MTAASVSRHVTVTLSAQLLSWALAIVVTFFVPGYMGDRNFGSLTLAIAFASTLSVFVGCGTSTVLVQQIAVAPQRTRSLIHTSLVLRSGIGAVAMVVGLVASALLGYSNDVRLLIGLLLTAQVIGQITGTFQAALGGLEAFVRQGASTLSERVTFSVATIALVLLKAPLWQFGAVYVLGATVSATVAWLTLRRLLRTMPQDRQPVTREAVRALATAGAPLLSTQVFATIYGDGSSAVLMSKLSSLRAIGWFGLAKRFSGSAQMVPIAIANAVLPRLTRLHAEGDRRAFARLAWRIIGVTLAAAVPAGAVLVLFPERLLALLHYPADFDGAIPVLRLSGAVIFIWFVQQSVCMILIAAGKQRAFALVTGVGALLAFPLSGACIWAGERYLRNGAFGAIAGDALLEVVMLGLYGWLLGSTLFPRDDTRRDAAGSGAVTSSDVMAVTTKDAGSS